MILGKLQNLILIALSLTLLACQQNSGAIALEPADINKIPLEMDIPDGQDEPDYLELQNPQPPVVAPKPEVPTTSKSAPTSEQGPDDQTPIEPPVENQELKVSTLIAKAHWTMVHEGKKIGTPCNFYLIRVLQLAGYPKGTFLANDFDIYAKKNFASYKAVDFTLDARLSEEARLKKYLWSFPQRTPFIMQWTRRRGPGHVALVERIGESLIIYQASLNRHTANRTQTRPNLLLKMGVGAVLTVYTDAVSR